MHAEGQSLPELFELYRRIDEAYAAAAEKTGLTCAGCDGVTCCTVDLILHTSVEMNRLKSGLRSLELLLQAEIRRRCKTMIEAKEEDPWGESYRNAVCVLNFDGKCVLYHHRPMICRLAGIPHFFVRPDGKRIESGGCTHYEAHIAPIHPNVRIDRTPFYHTMARLEIAEIQESGERAVPRTVSETLGEE